MKNSAFIKRLVLATTTLFILFGSASAWALNLDQAKAQGLVGETPSGYLASVNPNPASNVSQLINSINAKRKQEYNKISKKTGAAVQSVESLAGQKAINKTPPGQFVFDGRSWRKK